MRDSNALQLVGQCLEQRALSLEPQNENLNQVQVVAALLQLSRCELITGRERGTHLNAEPGRVKGAALTGVLGHDPVRFRNRDSAAARGADCGGVAEPSVGGVFGESERERERDGCGGNNGEE